jgi:hypothetical protein
MVLNDGNDIGFSSIDMIHIKGILEPVIQGLENHPFLQMFEPRINRSPSFNFYAKNGWHLESVNMNLTGPEPGKAFFQKHFKKLYGEEFSFETDKVYEKRLESISEKGCVLRISGMTNFTKYSPAGQIFYDSTLRSRIANHPQFVSPLWDNEQKEKAIREHGGEASLSYRVFVKGEVVEEGISVFDMDRIRPFYNTDKLVKHFEIPKEKYELFKHYIVVERPPNVEVVHIDADIGESAPTEIVVNFKINGKYKYVYNISLYNLTDKEQYQIFTYLIEKLSPNFIGLDVTEGTGRAIFRSLEEKISREHLVWCGFNEKIVIGFKKDDLGNVIFEDGKPVILEEYISEWSIKRLKELLYDNILTLPQDYRLDKQLNSVICTMTANRTVYECVSEEDHLLAAFRVFAISQWLNEWNTSQPINRKVFSKLGA